MLLVYRYSANLYLPKGKPTKPKTEYETYRIRKAASHYRN